MHALFFDLDGTLVDTESLAVETTVEVFRSLGIALSATDGAAIVGKKWREAVRILHERHPVELSRDALEERLLFDYRERTRRGIQEIRGATDAVRALAAEFPLWIVSGSPLRDIRHAVEALGLVDCFRGFVGAEDYPESKPAPDAYLEGLKRAGVLGKNSLVFEDSEAGIAAAKAAGIACAAITTANRYTQDTAHARWVLRDFVGITPAWVRERLLEIA